MLVKFSIPFKCIKYDVLCFYLQSLLLISCIPFLFAVDTFFDKMIIFFLMPVKREQLSCKQFIDTSWYNLFEVSLLFILAWQRWVFEKFSKSVRWYLCIWCSLPKARKPNLFWIPFFYKTKITVMTLFDNVSQNMCLYLSLWVRLKWVGYDKLLEFVLCLMDVHIIANVC